MTDQPSRFRQTLAGFFLFGAVFAASLLLLPLSIVGLHQAAPQFTQALPGLLVNLLFFWPQLLLLPNGVTTGHTFFGADVLIYISVAAWALVGLGFAWFTRNASLLIRGLLILPVIIAVGVLLHAGFAIFGLQATLDGP